MPKTKPVTDPEELKRTAPVIASPIERHIFVCNGKSCTAAGSEEVMTEFASILEAKQIRQGKNSKRRNPVGPVVLSNCGSVGLCTIGPAVLIYPDGVWYAQVASVDVAEIIESHIEQGRVVDRLAVVDKSKAGKD